MPWRCPILRHTTSHHPPPVSTEWMNVDASRQPPRCQGWNSSEMSWLKGSEDAEQNDFDGQSLMNFLDTVYECLEVYFIHVITTLIGKLKLWFHLFSLFFSNGRTKRHEPKHIVSTGQAGWYQKKQKSYTWNITNPRHDRPRSVSRVLSTHLHGITP